VSASHSVQLDPNEQRTLGALSGRIMKTGWAMAIVGLLASLLLCAAGDYAPKRVLYAYLTNFAFYISIPIAALLFVMVHQLCKTGTVTTYRRVGEIFAAMLPHLAVFVLPILAAVGIIYKWAYIEGDYLVDKKAPWLLIETWLPRMVLYLAVLSGMALWFYRKSLKQDETGDPKLSRKMTGAAAPLILVYGFVVSLFAFDMIMSLDPHWYSTIFGVYYFAGGFMAFHSIMAIFIIRLQDRGYLTRSVNDEHFHDIGKMMFAFVVFWAYIAYSQYMLIWYANIPETTVWFIRRGASTNPEHHEIANPFMWLTLILLIGHFFIPFFGLMSRWIKRSTTKLYPWAVWLVVMHWLDMIWLIRPELRMKDNSVATLPLNSVDFLALIACFIGLGGVFLAAFGKVAGEKRSLVAEKDPRLPEALAFENF
jgi:hypothetical protein